MNSRILILALALGHTTLWAQTEARTEAAAEPPQYYQVELLVFRNLDQSGTTGEIPRMPETEMSELLEQDLARLAAEPAAAIDLTNPLQENPEATAAEAGTALVVPATNESLLAGTAARLEKLQVYEVVSYLSWGQQAPDVTAAAELDIAQLGGDPAVVSGTVELHQRRYLHLALEVTLETSPETIEVTLSDPQQLPRGSAALPVIKDSRRIRLEEIQYFDQPNFGVLAVVSRMQSPAIAAAD